MAESGPQRERRVDPRTVGALVALTLITGMIDAVAFLGLDRVFAANMTGNLIILGIAIGGSSTLSIDGALVAIGAFFAGAALFGRVEPRTRSRHFFVTRLVRIELTLVAIATMLAIGFDVDDEFRRLLIIAILAGAMGARNETIRRIHFPELPTTVLTLAMAGFAAHEAERASSWGDRLRVIGIAAVIAGALISTLIVLHADVVWALAAITAAEGVTLLVAGRETTEAPDTVEA